MLATAASILVIAGVRSGPATAAPPALAPPGPGQFWLGGGWQAETEFWFQPKPGRTPASDDTGTRPTYVHLAG